MGIDWSKAPEATHYTPGNDREATNAVYWRVIEGVAVRAWAVRSNGQIALCSNPLGFDMSREDVVARPVEPWAGEGLPPVGTVCEYYADDGVWRSCEIVAHKDGQAVVWVSNAHIWASSGASLRPIRTPEQIAAEERERAIDDLCASIVSHYEAPKMSEHYLGLARALHDAGYRKQA